MKPEQRCIVGVVGGVAIGSMTTTAILLAPTINQYGALLLIMGAVLSLNVLLVGLRAPPLVRMQFSPRQSLFAAPAFVLVGVALLYAAKLPTAVVGILASVGILALVCAVALGFFSRSASSQDSSQAPHL
jgi:hypothetical protein